MIGGGELVEFGLCAAQAGNRGGEDDRRNADRHREGGRHALRSEPEQGEHHPGNRRNAEDDGRDRFESGGDIGGGTSGKAEDEAGEAACCIADQDIACGDHGRLPYGTIADEIDHQDECLARRRDDEGAAENKTQLP